MTPKVYLICGSTGAGKSTYSLALSRRASVPVFSIDDWMVTLFGADSAATPNWNWIAARVARCETQIIKTVAELGHAGLGAILDIGLLRAARRREIVDELSCHGLDVALHLLDIDADERWRRVSARNDKQGETYRLNVTRPMFDFIESIWQRPDAGELAALNGTRIDAAISRG